MLSFFRFLSDPQTYFILSAFMANNSLSPISRRGLLQWGLLTGMLGIVGCGEEGAIEKVETPPTPGGNRNRLQKLQETPVPKSKKK
jgi:hypothetical protein